MPRRFSFLLWVLVAAAVALVPLACGSSSTNDDGSTMSVQRPDSMTKS